MLIAAAWSTCSQHSTSLSPRTGKKGREEKKSKRRRKRGRERQAERKKRKGKERRGMLQGAFGPRLEKPGQPV